MTKVLDKFSIDVSKLRPVVLAYAKNNLVSSLECQIAGHKLGNVGEVFARD